MGIHAVDANEAADAPIAKTANVSKMVVYDAQRVCHVLCCANGEHIPSKYRAS